MKKYILVLLSLMMSNCALCSAKFADERFNNPLISMAKDPWDITLTPTSIINDNRLGTQLIDYNCQILENKQNFIKYQCEGMRYTGGLVKNMPGKRMITFEIENWDKFFEKYSVKRTEYEWIEQRKIWSQISGGYFFVEGKK